MINWCLTGTSDVAILGFMKQTDTGKLFAEFIQQELGPAIADAKEFPNKVIPTNSLEIATELGNIAEKTGCFHLSDATAVAKKHGANNVQMMALVGFLSGGPVAMKCFKDNVEQPKSAYADAHRAILEGREDETEGIEIRWCSKKPVSLSGPTIKVTGMAVQHGQWHPKT